MVNQVLLSSGEEIIDHDYAVPARDQTVHEVAPNEPGPTRDQDPKPLPLQPERELSPRIRRSRGHRRPERQPGAGLESPRGDPIRDCRDGRVDCANVRRGGLWDEGEDEGGDGDSDEDEEEALLAEEVVDRAGGGGEPGFWGFWGVIAGRSLGLVASVNQLHDHLAAD